MKKNRVLIVILLSVLVCGGVSTYKYYLKDMRNRKYDDTSSIEVSLVNNDTIKGNHATYYLKYNLEDEGVFVFSAEFL